MKLIEPSVKLIKEVNPLILIEKIGRVCYKSDSDYTPETAVKFIKQLVKRGHLSVLEHAVFVFECESMYLSYYYKDMPFVNMTTVILKDSKTRSRTLLSCNLRAIIERNYTFLQGCLLEKYPELKELFEPVNKPEGICLTELNNYENITTKEVSAHLYTTFSFTTDRGVSHEMVRHRIASYTQESTRYCNYSNNKFGGELQFIRPATFNEWTGMQKLTYMQSLELAEKNYMSLVNGGLPAQFARGVLPTDVRTQIIMTANHAEWEHFFDLRSRGKTGSPHPNMKVVAQQAEKTYYEEYNNFMVLNK